MYTKILEGVRVISDNEFIQFYSQICVEIHKRYGKGDVEKEWSFLSKNSPNCIELDKSIKKDGLKGIYNVNKKGLGTLGSRCSITLRDDEVVIDIHNCVIIEKLIVTNLEPYENYCEHCEALMAPIIKRNGFFADFYRLDKNKGKCRIHVRKNRIHNQSKTSQPLKNFYR